MHINFNHIHAENFLSYEAIDANLNSSGYTIIRGINENPDDASNSNGSGKSSLWEALTWCLTGSTIRGTKEVKRFNAPDKSTCSVTVDFNIDGSDYRIVRTKDPSNLFIYINGEDKSGKGIKDTTKLLSDLLPDLNSQLLGSVIILGQGLPQRFSNNSPSGRKDVLEQLSKSDFMLEDLKKRLSNRKDTINSIIRKYQDDSLSLTTTKNVLTKQIENNELKLESLNNQDVTLFEENKKMLMDSIAHISKDIDELNDSIDNNTSNQTLINNTLNDVKMESMRAENEVKEEFNSNILEISTKVSSKKSEVASLDKEIRRIKNMKDVCPTCGQKLPNVHKPETTEQERYLQELKEECENLDKELIDIKAIQQNKCNVVKQRFIEKINSLTESLQELLKDATQLKNQIKDKTTQFNNFNAQVQKIDAQISTIEHDKETLNELIANDKLKISELEENILYNTNELEDTKLHLDVINKMDTLIKRDFRGYLLSNVINFIDMKAKEYANCVFGTDKIAFCIDGNNISISYCGKEYENLSGGERQRVDLIIQFAIRDMLCNYLNFSSNIIVLDEIVDNLDNVGCQNVLNLISKSLKDVDSIFIISHHHEIPMPIDNEIIFVKGADGISRIR